MAPKRKRQTKDPTWESIAREAQQYRDGSINQVLPPVPDVPRSFLGNATSLPASVLSEEEIQITELCSTELLSEIASGRITATLVTSAFLSRAAIAQKLVGYSVLLLSSATLYSLDHAAGSY